MESIITFTCTNSSCKNYDLEKKITEPDFFIGYCEECDKHGKLEIIHGKEKFNINVRREGLILPQPFG